MKDFFQGIVAKWLGSHKVSLAVIVGVWILFSPTYNNFVALTEKVHAHERRFEKLDMIDEKLTELMIELGIQKHKIEAIERRHYNFNNTKEK